MSYKGERLLPLHGTAASQLEKNRLVTITKSTDIVEYTTYGNSPDAVTRSRSDENNYATEAMPLDFADKTFFIDLVGTVAKGDPLFAAGIIGKAKTADYIAQSRSVPEEASPVNGDIFIVPAGIDWEAGTNQNKKAVYVTNAWVYTAATAGDIVYITDEGRYVVFNGTAWVTTDIACYAGEVGATGNTIVAYNVVTRDLSAQQGALLVFAGKTVSETDADAEVVISDDRIAVGDIVIASIAAQAGTASITHVVVTANTATVTLSGNGGAGTIIAYAIYRALV